MCALALIATSFTRAQAAAEGQGSAHPKQLVILDTDIGDDIDDAFALALVESLYGADAAAALRAETVADAPR